MPERVEFVYFESGHMMYVHTESLHALTGSVREFIEAGSPTVAGSRPPGP